jgi:hypothetical protein
MSPCGRAGRRASGTRDISFYCEDIHATVEHLRGVEFAGDVEDRGYGLVIDMRVPGGAIRLFTTLVTRTFFSNRSRSNRAARLRFVPLNDHLIETNGAA